MGSPEKLPDHVALLADALGDRYQLGHQLGAGGMAAVFQARDLKLQREVALKVFNPEAGSAIGAERFLREVQLTANLNHPHILPLHDSGDVAGVLYYIMPVANGGTLRDLIDREGPLGAQRVINLARRVSSALDAAHRHGVVHRDVKPDNILYHDGLPVVADFGIARPIASGSHDSLTGPGLMVGTPLYMSPEQIEGDHTIDGRTDQYAFGCVLFEALTGKPPFPGTEALDVAMRHLREQVPSVGEFGGGSIKAVNAVFRRALAKRPEHRFRSAEALAEMLAAALAAGGKPKGATSGPARKGISPEVTRSGPTELGQEVRFCRAKDGVTIAYATVGQGTPLVKVANWLSHLEHDWKSPMWGHWWTGLARHNQLVRYDQRGTGLSDREVDEQSFETWLSDLESVVDQLGLERFALLGISQGGAVAVRFAVDHPERVSHLILHGAYATGRLVEPSDEDRQRAELDISLIKHGWGQDNPAFRQVFSTLFFPGANPEQLEWFNELQRVSATPEMASRMMEVFHRIDVRSLLPDIRVPTLVLHCTGDARVPYGSGRYLAKTIPGARFISLESDNHIPLAEEPAWEDFLEGVWSFMNEPTRNKGAGI